MDVWAFYQRLCAANEGFEAAIRLADKAANEKAKEAARKCRG